MRKVFLGALYIVVCGFLGYTGIEQKSDLLGLSTIFGAMAVGLGTIVWGNAQEWKSKQKPEISQ